MRKMIKELLMPNGIYSIRRLTAMVGLFLLSVSVFVHFVYPDRADVQVITILGGVTSVGTGVAAFKKYDK